jgi:hypothetical protein
LEAITTREAGQILGANRLDALRLLKAAKVPHRAIQSEGQVHQYLWDAEAVHKLRQVLKKEMKGGSDEQ